MTLKLTLEDKDGEQRQSLKRIIAFSGFVIMSAAFCLTAYRGRIQAEAFLTYPLGLVILYVPQLAMNMLKIWKGREGE